MEIISTYGYKDFFFSSKSKKTFSQIVIIFSISLIFFPTFSFLINGISLTAITNESLSYRYFYSLRLLQGEASSIVLPQGHVLTIIQHGFNLVLTYVIGLPIVDTLRRMEYFGYLTLLTASLLSGGILVWIYRSEKIDWQIKILLALAFVSFCYASRSGLSAFTTPDYGSFEAILTMSAICIFVNVRAIDSTHSHQLLLPFLGVFAAILVGIKASLIFTALLPLLGLLTRGGEQQSILSSVKVLLVFSLWFVVSLLFLLCAFYCFNLKNIFSSLSGWANFIAHPGSEPNFWKNLIGSLYGTAEEGTGYGYAWVLIPTNLLVQFIALISPFRGKEAPQERIVIVILALTSLLYLFFLFHRPAGTTLWETSLYLTAATCISLLIKQNLRITMWVFCLLLLMASLISAIMNFTAILDISRFKKSSVMIREINTFASAQPGMVAVIPNNDHTIGTLEEGLMKGVSDFPSWNITKGQRLLNQLAPGLLFSRDASLISRNLGIFWIGIPGELAPIEISKAIQERQLYNSKLCNTWQVATWKWRVREVVVCKGIPKMNVG